MGHCQKMCARVHWGGSAASQVHAAAVGILSAVGSVYCRKPPEDLLGAVAAAYAPQLWPEPGDAVGRLRLPRGRLLSEFRGQLRILGMALPPLRRVHLQRRGCPDSELRDRHQKAATLTLTLTLTLITYWWWAILAWPQALAENPRATCTTSRVQNTVHSPLTRMVHSIPAGRAPLQLCTKIMTNPQKGC
jgi:hypothetical protein